MVPVMNEDSAVKQCRICLENDDSNDIISPCFCSGSSSYVHRKCLDFWRRENAKRKSSEYCDVCHFKYVIENVINDRNKLFQYYLLIISDLIVVILCFQPLVIFIAYLLKMFEDRKIQNLFPNSMNGFMGCYFTACLLLLAVFGFFVVIIFFIVSVFDATHAHTSIFDGDTTGEDVFYTCTFVGFFLTIIVITMFLAHTMEYHRNKLWSKQASYNDIVKDFTGRREDLNLYR